MSEEMMKQMALAQAASAASRKVIWAYSNGSEIRTCGFRNDELRRQGYRICAMFDKGRKIR